MKIIMFRKWLTEKISNSGQRLWLFASPEQSTSVDIFTQQKIWRVRHFKAGYFNVLEPPAADLEGTSSTMRADGYRSSRLAMGRANLLKLYIIFAAVD